MTQIQTTALVALAAFLWSFVGLLAGIVSGLALGIEGRPIMFFAVVGMAVGWFGFSGSRVSIAQHTAPDDAARAWLDDFLVKQQRK